MSLNRVRGWGGYSPSHPSAVSWPLRGQKRPEITITKKDIITKNRFRIITSLILVTLLVTALAAPAIAATGTNTLNGYTASFSVTNTQHTGTASISSVGSPTYLEAAARNYLYDDLNEEAGYSNWGTVSGYAAVAAEATDILTLSSDYGYAKVHALVQYTDGSFWIFEQYAGTLRQWHPDAVVD